MQNSSDHPQLILLDVEPEQAFPLLEGATKVGRGKENDVHLDDQAVSRFQCSLVREGDEVRIRDANSHNATWVNGEPITDKPLKDGDLLRMGRLRLRFVTPLAMPARVERTAKSVADKSAGDESPVDQEVVDERVVAKAPRRRSVSQRVAQSQTRSSWLNLIIVLWIVAGLIWCISFFAARWNQDASPPSSAEQQELNESLRVTLQEMRDQTRDLAVMKVRLEQSERALAELRHRQETNPQPTATESGEDVESRANEITSLEDTIRQLRTEREALEFDLATAADAAAALSERANAPAPSQPETAQDRRVGSQSARRTKVATPDEVPHVEERRPRTARDIDKMVERLKSALDDYATPSTTVDSLEPELTDVSLAGGARAAAGLLSVFRHANKLHSDADKTLEFLRRRVERLLQEAEKTGGGGYREGSGKSGRREGSYRKVGDDIEKQQRALELSQKKVEIKEVQLARLRALMDHIRQAFRRLTDLNGVRHLTKQFVAERSPAVQLAILEGLSAARWVDAVPTLLRRFSAKDEGLRQAVRQSLISIVGEDLGGEKAAWQQWWDAQGEKKL